MSEPEKDQKKDGSIFEDIVGEAILQVALEGASEIVKTSAQLTEGASEAVLGVVSASTEVAGQVLEGVVNAAGDIASNIDL